ncbi:MAG: hypothetical protein WD688_18160 [Candidatus Binatia bacterium]
MNTGGKMAKITILIRDSKTRFQEKDKVWMVKMLEEEIDRVFGDDLERIYRELEASKPPTPPDPFASFRKRRTP